MEAGADAAYCWACFAVAWACWVVCLVVVEVPLADTSWVEPNIASAVNTDSLIATYKGFGSTFSDFFVG